jgi:hypothetical protein
MNGLVNETDCPPIRLGAAGTRERAIEVAVPEAVEPPGPAESDPWMLFPIGTLPQPRMETIRKTNVPKERGRDPCRILTSTTSALIQTGVAEFRERIIYLSVNCPD